MKEDLEIIADCIPFSIRLKMNKCISKKNIALAILAATILLFAGSFYLLKADQIIKINGISALDIISGRLVNLSIKDPESLVFGFRVLIIGLTNIWLSIIIYLLIFMQYQIRRQK